MGANIYWRPVKSGTYLSPPGAKSEFIKALELPRTLSEKDLSWLAGFKAGRPDFAGSIEQIIAAIEIHHEIEIYAEY